MDGPLNRLLDEIQALRGTVEEPEKIIFIGDYADHGLNSKEVLDRLLDLEYPAVFLAGNHDHMATRFFRKVEVEGTGAYNEWFSQGAYNTLRSLLKGGKELEKFEKINADSKYGWQAREKIFDGIKIPPKYVNFFEGLKYSHQETFDCGYAKVGFRFFHGIPRIDQTLDEQMVGSFEDFEKFLRIPFPQLRRHNQGLFFFADPLKVSTTGKVHSSEETFIWNRGIDLRFSFGGEVVVHGHTPILAYNDLYEQSPDSPNGVYRAFTTYGIESRLPFLFSRDRRARFLTKDFTPKDQDVIEFDCGDGAVESINVDTGAICKWGGLTALGLSEKLLQKGELYVLTTLTVHADQPIRSASGQDLELLAKTVPDQGSVIHRIIKTQRFGADMSDPERDPVFPFQEFREKATA
jgi:hypothetical protein